MKDDIGMDDPAEYFEPEYLPYCADDYVDPDDDPRTHGCECVCEHCVQDHPERDTTAFEEGISDTH